VPSRIPPTSLRPPERRRKLLTIGTAALTLLSTITTTAALTAAPASAAEAGATTAWKDGSFHLDPTGVVRRSNLILGQPNVNPTASMPLGNGSLGVAAWAANGFTAQLNRSDTMPNRKSPGQLNIPGASVITHAADFTGTLDLTTGQLVESGGGMTLKAWVDGAKDLLIVDVTGADPNVAQTASINLWSPRKPVNAVSGTVGTMAETWVDNAGSGKSNLTFGSLAAITAGGQNVTTTVVNATKVQTSFKPNADGSFRVVVASPGWKGAGDAGTTATSLIGDTATATSASLQASQTSWWNTFWTHTALIEMNSTDGNAAYIENLRTLYQYEIKASMKEGIYPGSQAGEADMFAWAQDQQTWDAASYWLWNLRAVISANVSSGNADLNTPIWDMYIDDLPAITTWTAAQMGGLPGACVPETMRFNGNGGDPGKGVNSSCSEPSAPNWNALNITSGPEISLYMWQHYQATGDQAFLQKAFPFMEATAQFLLTYQHVGTDGYLHANANAHETQWSVDDPTTNIVADQTMFPLIAQAADVLGITSAGDPLLAQFAAAIPQIPPYPRTDQATRTQLLNPDYSPATTATADATGTDMIAISYQPAAARQNGENIELEPLWPWNQVTDQDANLFALEQRSYTHRPNKGGNDWSLDAIDSARLQNPADVASNLISITKGHQVYPNGFADLGASVGFQPYIEQSASVAAATSEALAQGFDGIIRFAPAWPADWDGSGSVYVQHNTKVDVQVQGGTLVTAAIEAGATETLKVKNPWAGQSVRVVSGTDASTVVVAPTSAAIISVPVTAGSSYLVELVSAPTSGRAFAQVTGTAPTAARHLGTVQLGLDPAGPATTAVVGTVLASTNAKFGVSQAEYPAPGDGATTASVVAGLTARTTVGDQPAGNHNMYFDIDDAVARTGNYNATVSLSYYDGGTGSFAVQYDGGASDPYHNAGTVTLTGSNTWKTASFTVSGAYFGGSQHANGDFRLSGLVPIVVHSVAVSLTGTAVPTGNQFPPAPAVTTPKSGVTVPTSSSISGTAAPDEKITVKDGSATLCTVTAADSGAWTCTPAAVLSTGKHVVTATALDPTGLTGPASAALTFYASDSPPGTATVGTVLGANNSYYGMTQDPNPSYDGPTTATVVAGLSARASTNGNIYFNVDDAMAHGGDYTAGFTVSYYDLGTGSFNVQYDDGTSDPYKGSSSITLKDTKTWKTATVSSVVNSNAVFGGKQNGGNDFRLRNGNGQITIHSVVVKVSGFGVPDTTAFPPAPKITAPVAGPISTGKPAVTGTSEPDATVTVSDGASAVCTATADHAGAWTCTPGTALTDGAHSLTATSTDITDTPSIASAPVSVTVTTVSPSHTELTLPTGPVTVGSDVLASVTVSSSAAVIAGHLVIRSGNTVVGSADVAGAAPSVTTDVTLTGLPVGELSLTATFEGSDAVTQSHSDPVKLTVSFSDYASTAPFFDDVMWLAEKGISTGYPDGTFHPGSPVERQAMAAFLYRSANPGEAAPACTVKPFPDVEIRNQFCGDIAWLKAQHLSNGFTDGSFGPTLPIDRQAMAAFLYRWKNPGVTPAACTVKPFTDIAVGQQFCGEITWLKAQHVTNGFADGSYRAGASTDRQTMAAFLHRLSTQG